VQLLARDVIVSTRAPQYLSVRNSLQGVVTSVEDDGEGSDLIAIDIGAGASILARVTHAATRELAVANGIPVWALIKAVSLRGHSFPAPSPASASRPPLARGTAT
jgi:molybdate transport system ATP-binding protein